MCFTLWDTYVLFDRNIAPALSTQTVMGYSITTPIKNKTTQINSISQHTSMIAKYSDSLTDNVTVL